MARIIKIQNTTVSISPQWNIFNTIKSKKTATFIVTNLLDLERIDEGDEVSIEIDGIKQFGGVVFEVEEYEPTPTKLYYKIKAVDFTYLTDKRLVAKIVNNKDMVDLVNDDLEPFLTDEGITIGDIPSGYTIKKTVFNYITVSKCFDYLTDITGLEWDIDENKVITIFDRSENKAPFELTNAVLHRNFKRNRNLKDYRNVQYIRAGQGRTTTTQIENPSPKPDGQSRTFTTRFKIAEKPEIYINAVQVPPADVGINGLDTGKKWYFTFGSDKITQDIAEVVLNVTDILETRYIGLINILTATENALEITDRADREPNTSGRYENITKELSITANDQALQFNEGILAKYDEVKDIITFSTENPYLKAGMLVTINKPLYSINDSFLIESVNIRPVGTTGTEYQVKCLDGQAIGGWEQYFSQLINNSKSFTIQEDEILIILNTINETVGHRGEYSIKVIDPNADVIPFIISDDLIIGELVQTSIIVEKQFEDETITVAGEYVTEENPSENYNLQNYYDILSTRYGLIVSDTTIISDSAIITAETSEVRVND